MRSSPPLVALLLLAASCTGSGAEQAETPLAETVAAAGLDTMAVTETARSFLDAYAQSGTEVATLGGLVTGPELEDWIRWLEVRNRGRAERLTGRASVRRLRVRELREDVALMDVDAEVILTLEQEQGDAIRSPRRFGSPMILVRGDHELGWEVVDATRDGRSMRRSISILRDAEDEAGGITLEVVSIHRFAIGTVANLVIRNGTGSPQQVDASRAVLRADAGVVDAAASTSTLQTPIAPGATVEGSLDFPPIPLEWLPEQLTVAFGDEPGRVMTIELPRAGFSVDTTA